MLTALSKLWQGCSEQPLRSQCLGKQTDSADIILLILSLFPVKHTQISQLLLSRLQMLNRSSATPRPIRAPFPQQGGEFCFSVWFPEKRSQKDKCQLSAFVTNPIRENHTGLFHWKVKNISWHPKNSKTMSKTRLSTVHSPKCTNIRGVSGFYTVIPRNSPSLLKNQSLFCPPCPG